MPAVERLGLVANLARQNVLELVARVRAWAAARAVTLVLGDMGFGTPEGSEACVPVERLGESCDAVVVLGGDGTILRAAPRLAPSGIPLVAVNTGKLGFLATAESDEMEALLDELLGGALREEARSLLQVTCAPLAQGMVALNDVVIHRAEVARVVEYEVRIGGALVSRFFADGVCVATPTGSTAYSLSAGGPVLHPGVEAIIVTPLCAHTLAMRSMVVSDRETIRVRPLSVDAPVHLLIDGQACQTLGSGHHVEVTRAPCTVRLLQRQGRTFYGLLRRKLGWASTKEE